MGSIGAIGLGGVVMVAFGIFFIVKPTPLEANQNVIAPGTKGPSVILVIFGIIIIFGAIAVTSDSVRMKRT